jgi:hypothetical protein
MHRSRGGDSGVIAAASNAADVIKVFKIMPLAGTSGSRMDNHDAEVSCVWG